jgi:hypothetical protein
LKIASKEKMKIVETALRTPSLFVSTSFLTRSPNFFDQRASAWICG